ncbi:MAG: hypothetical protein L6Q29_05390, partial [Candidatus Pacebacteria bacterium]|nr:hypothetical protein [Candidatus Paceibacterota bacterium]
VIGKQLKSVIGYTKPSNENGSLPYSTVQFIMEDGSMLGFEYNYGTDKIGSFTDMIPNSENISSSFKSIILKKLLKACPITDKDREIIGIELDFESEILNFYISGDEGFVLFGREPRLFLSAGFNVNRNVLLQ